MTNRFSLNLRTANNHLKPAILYDNLISLDLLWNGQAFAGSHVEFPAMPIAFDDVVTQFPGGEWSAFVWAKVVGGIEFAVNIVYSKLAPV